MLMEYFTVKDSGWEEVMIQKSRFIGYTKRVETEKEAYAFIEDIKRKHADATHNCSAYIIGEHDQHQKANDDGEPSGTAGIPMLEVLKKKELKDTVIVVTRYFGGVKLGAGGLIRAYSRTTSAALAAAGIVKRQLMQGFSISVDYALLGKLENALRNSRHVLHSIEYLENVEMIVYVENGDEENFRDWIVDLTSNQAIITLKDNAYMELDIRAS